MRPCSSTTRASYPATICPLDPGRIAHGPGAIDDPSLVRELAATKHAQRFLGLTILEATRKRLIWALLLLTMLVVGLTGWGVSLASLTGVKAPYTRTNADGNATGLA